MISASNTLQNILKQNSSVTIDAGCTIEYNMNDMVNSPSVIFKNYSTGATLVEDDIYKTIGDYKPFKNVFPYKSIIENNRPEHAGIKYGIIGDISASELEIIPGSWVNIPDYGDPKNMTYARSGTTLNYRTYYPGIDNKYKYFVGKKNESIRVAVEYSKDILVNKIVVKFEIAHSVPQAGKIKTQSTSGGAYTDRLSFTNSNIKAFGTDAPGTMTMYYNGSTWSFNESHLVPGTAATLRGVELEVAALTGYIGLIEICPKYVIDISSDMISFDIQKEASIEQEITPVGIVSANSLSLSMNKYDTSSLKILSYDKTSTNFATNIIYLYKDAEIKPFLKVYYTGAPLSDSKGNYEKVSQGTFYMDSWDVGEFTDTSITALDGAKKLQQIFSPSILCENFSSTAIIRRLLDSVGFPNYRINTSSTAANEEGVVTPKYWWTDTGVTIWQAIQEICKDNQMVATFDENNVLQFYTRNYLYDSTRTVAWQLTYNADGSTLPNIASLSKKEFRTGNKLIVKWNSRQTTQDSLEARPLWTSENSWLGAMALVDPITDTATTGDTMNLVPITTNKYLEDSILYSFSGYVLIDSEIIEYDAIEYQYKTTQNGNWIYVNITNESDVKKYRPLAYRPTWEYFRPSGKIRIKTRGAFGTRTAAHSTNIDNNLTGWTVSNVGWY
jgi:hypothetical protein